MPAKETYYYCDLFELPKFTNPNHMIQFEIIVNPKNKRHVHHLLVYLCDDDFIPPEPLARECGQVEIPTVFMSNCFSKMMIAWGIGGAFVSQPFFKKKLDYFRLIVLYIYNLRIIVFLNKLALDLILLLSQNMFY